MTTENALLKEYSEREYQHGFVTDIEADEIPPGLSEDVVRLISEKKSEPSWLLDWRLKAYRHWLTMEEPEWPNVKYPPIDYQKSVYYSAPKQLPKLNSLDEVDPVLLETYAKLGISLEEQKALSGVAVDAVFDSVFPWQPRFGSLWRNTVSSSVRFQKRFTSILTWYRNI